MQRKFIRLSSSILSVLLILSVFLQLPHTEAVALSTDRYTVLVLDTSGSMRGTPVEKEREAAKKFCEDILDASGTNYVALVTLDSTSKILSDFTTEIDQLSSKIETITSNGGTNFYSALYTANSLLENVDSNCIQNIVLCSDGLPEHGEYSNDGPYTSNYYNGYANAAYQLASNYKLNYNIYTLGFFHSLSGSNLEFGRQFMSDLASDPSYYYDVVNPEDLLFTFGSVAEDVLTVDKDPIILIPGIMGSRLFLDSECSESQCTWPPVSSQYLNLEENMQKDTLYSDIPCYGYDNSDKYCCPRIIRPFSYEWLWHQVEDDAPYDIKRRKSWNDFVSRVDSEFPFFHGTFPLYFNDSEINLEIFGNILYGFVLNAGGFSCEEATVAGSIYSFITKLGFDNSEDKDSVIYGYDLYESVKKDYYYIHQ